MDAETVSPEYSIVIVWSLAFYNERFVMPTTKRERAALSPYTERGFAGFDQMSPWSPMDRRKSYFESHHDKEKDYE
jgi:nitrate reductase beta subunit